MNPTVKTTFSVCTNEIDASCRVPLLALFGGAALWLVAGLALGIGAIMSFHKPDLFADCQFLTFGRSQAAANDLLLYGFCIPAALGVLLWIFSRLSQTPLALPIVPVVAANLWHLGVLIGTIAILTGNSTGHLWLEYPRPAAVLLFAAFLLTAVTAAATFGFRQQRDLFPAHWFLFAALLLFPWIYSTANLFLVSNQVPRGVVQAIIGWWFGNNLIFVWLALAGVGMAFYFLPKIAGNPLGNSGYAITGFLTLLFFGTWAGIPQGAPVPAWMPTLSSVMTALTLVPLIAIALVLWQTIVRNGFKCGGGPFCFIKFGMLCFIASTILYISLACPRYSRVLEFTWFGTAQTQLQLLGFFAMILFGAIYEILPRIMEAPLPFPKAAKAQFWITGLGILLFVVPLAVGGLEQGMKVRDAAVPFADASAVALKFLRVSTTGQLLILLGSLPLVLNLFVMTIRWKVALLKTLISAIKAPLPEAEVKA